jgi:hypothetical protein
MQFTFTYEAQQYFIYKYNTSKGKSPQMSLLRQNVQWFMYDMLKFIFIFSC